MRFTVAWSAALLAGAAIASSAQAQGDDAVAGRVAEGLMGASGVGYESDPGQDFSVGNRAVMATVQEARGEGCMLHVRSRPASGEAYEYSINFVDVERVRVNGSAVAVIFRQGTAATAAGANGYGLGSAQVASETADAMRELMTACGGGSGEEQEAAGDKG